MSTRADYQVVIGAGISASKAYEAISQVNRWWGEDFDGSAKKINDQFRIRFGQTFVDFKITEAIPEKRIVWTVMDCYLPWQRDKTEWTGTKLVWIVTEHNGASTVEMTHVGLSPATECFETCIKGWDEHVKGSLLKLMTEGKGQPQRKAK